MGAYCGRPTSAYFCDRDAVDSPGGWCAILESFKICAEG
jgi:hypothetical protein